MYFRSNDAGKSEHKRGKERALLQWEKLRPVCKSASEKNGDDGAGFHLAQTAVVAGGSSQVFAAAASTVHSLSLHVTGTQVRRSEIQSCRPKFLRQKSQEGPAPVLPPLDGAAVSLPMGCADRPLQVGHSNASIKPFTCTSSITSRDFTLPDVPAVSPTPSQSQASINSSVNFALSNYKKHTYAEQKLTELYKEKSMSNKFKDWAHKKHICLPVLKENNEDTLYQATSRISPISSPAIIYNSEQSAATLDVTFASNPRDSFITIQDPVGLANKSQPEDDAGKDPPTYSAEIHKGRLVLRGKGCSSCLYKNWSSRTVETITTVQFFDVDFNEIACNLSKLTSRFPGLSNVEFYGTNITSLHQLSCLGLLQGVNSLVIGEEGNPVTDLSLWKAFVCHIMNGCSLKWLNGKEVTVEDTNQAVRLFRGYVNAEWAAQKYVQSIHTHQTESRSSMLGDEEEEKNNKDIIEALKYEVNPRIMKVAKSFVDDVQTKVVLALKLHNLLVSSWPRIFRDTVNTAMEDFSDIDSHMKVCMDKLLSADNAEEL